MKRGLIVFITASMMIANEAEAQIPAKEKLDSYRIAFFTRRLNLTSQEAEKFWPVYNELQNKKNEIQLERAATMRRVNQNESSMSEKELVAIADKLIAMEVREANISMEFHKKFREILPPVKVVRLYQAENQYRLILLQELRQTQENRNFNQRRGPGLNGPFPDHDLNL